MKSGSAVAMGGSRRCSEASPIRYVNDLADNVLARAENELNAERALGGGGVACFG
jgi:hypothetical protein